MFNRLIILLASILLVSCNLPASGGPTPDLVATEVSKLLTEAPLVVITETPPVLVITATPPLNNATATATLVVEPEVTASPTVTASSLPTQTNSPTATAAARPDGPPTWTETFKSGSSFGISGEGYDDGNTRIFIRDEDLQLVSINVNSWRGWRLASHKPQNYYLLADFRVENCSGSDQYGLITQAPNYDSGFGYYFGITCDGRFSIQKWNESGLTNLAGWDETSAIQAGSEQENQIGVLKADDTYQFFVNNVRVAEVEDNFFKEPGFFGPYIAGLTTPNFTVHLKEISYWKNPE